MQPQPAGVLTPQQAAQKLAELAQMMSGDRGLRDRKPAAPQVTIRSTISKLI
jgi:hypothetical protein